jgi:uncharacterized membrane protein
MSRARIGYLAVLGGAVAWCGLLWLAPFLSGTPLALLGDAVYAGLGRICHQIDSRSFHTSAGQVAACIRCASLYLGFAAGVAAYPIARTLEAPVFPPRWILAAGLAPMALDVALGWLGLGGSSVLSRILTGSFAGMTLAWLIVPAAIDAALEWQNSARRMRHEA